MGENKDPENSLELFGILLNRRLWYESDMKLDHDIAAELGSILKHRREMLFVTQSELAEVSGFHRSYIADIERGARNLGLRNLYRICKALDISLSVVFKQLEASLEENRDAHKRERRNKKSNAN
jgi:DNA-binding XRE family transcriptional regulator